MLTTPSIISFFTLYLACTHPQQQVYKKMSSFDTDEIIDPTDVEVERSRDVLLHVAVSKPFPV